MNPHLHFDTAADDDEKMRKKSEYLHQDGCDYDDGYYSNGETDYAVAVGYYY